MKTKYRYILVGLLLFLLMILIACGTSQAASAHDPMTPTVCPPVYWTPSANRRPMFIFVMFDGTKGYQEAGYVNTTKDILKEILIQNVHTGDRVVVGVNNQNTALNGMDGSVFYDNVFFLTVDNLTPTPLIPLSPTPLNNGTIAPIPTGQLRQTEAARTLDAAQEIERHAIDNYFCALGQTITESEKINQIVESIRLSSAKDFSRETIESFPSPKEFERMEVNPLFESLSEASSFILRECDKKIYGDCILLMFSNMQNYHTYQASSNVPPSDLKNTIDVISVIYNCKYDLHECANRVIAWKGHLNSFHAKSFEPVLNPDEGQSTQNASIVEKVDVDIETLENEQSNK